MRRQTVSTWPGAGTIIQPDQTKPSTLALRLWGVIEDVQRPTLTAALIADICLNIASVIDQLDPTLRARIAAEEHGA